MDIFRTRSKNDSAKKIILNIDKVGEITRVLKEITGHKIVVTIGTWDMLHIGHLRYLVKAKEYGDILVVGVDTDRAVKIYKGPLRPIVPQEERLEMLSYQSCVDIATLIDDIDDNRKWQYGLIKKIRPDVFVAVEDSYSEEQKKDIQQFCEKLIVLPRQAENTSTSKTIQETVKKTLVNVLAELERR